jgi:outer membrane protein assembly factor BamD
MLFRKSEFIFSLVIVFCLSLAIAAQTPKPQDGGGSQSQRMEVMRQKLDIMRRSLNGALSGLKDDAKEDRTKKEKDDKTALDTPVSRLKALEKEADGLASQVNNLLGKMNRSEKYEASDIDSYEASVSELQTRVDGTLLETAKERGNPVSDVGKPREIKKKKKFLGIFGGGTDEYEELIGSVAPGRDKELFIVATREVRRKNHEVGRLLFTTIITTYPDSPYLPMAKLAIADSFFLQGTTSDLIQASAAYQDWLTFFPTHPLADRVLLKIAESEMRQIGRPDRDASRAKKAEQRLKALIQQYPTSLLRGDAERRLAEVQDNLGLHNLWIANFYYKRAVDQKKTGLKGAQSRYLEILDKYPHFGWMDEALFKLAVTYQVEEETDQAARYYQRIVQDYPHGDFVEKSKEQLNLLGAKIPEPSEEGLKREANPNKSFWTNFTDELLGTYELTIDKNGVLMTKDFDKEKFELIDAVIANSGELDNSQIPKALTAVTDRPVGAPVNK